MCGGTYGMNVTLRTDAAFATHAASGTLNATLTARGTGTGTGTAPPKAFAAATAADYEGVTELPVDGGQQPVAGGFTSGGDGWVHSGTITIARRPPR